MRTVISPSTPSPSRTEPLASPHNPQASSASVFDQHLEVAQRAAASPPAPAAAQLTQPRASAPAPAPLPAHIVLKSSTPDKLAGPASSSAGTASSTATAGSAAKQAASAHAGANDTDDAGDTAATALSDSTLISGIWGFLGAAASGGPLAGAAAVVDGALSGMAPGAGGKSGLGAVALADVVDGSAGGSASLQANTLLDSSGGSLSAPAAGATPAAVAMLLGATDKDLLANAGQPVALLTPPGSAAPQAVHALQLPAPVDGHAFQQALGQQVTWLAGQEIKQASIRLHPQDMGQLEVKVSVNQGTVDVVFNAQHAAAASAVQQTLPQLAHMLAQHGLALGHAEVGHQPAGHSQGRESQHGRAQGSNDTANDTNSGLASVAIIGTVSLLDAFA